MLFTNFIKFYIIIYSLYIAIYSYAVINFVKFLHK